MSVYYKADKTQLEGEGAVGLISEQPVGGVRVYLKDVDNMPLSICSGLLVEYWTRNWL